MYWFFSILCFLLLAFNLDWIPGRPWDNHYAAIWTWERFRLVRIMPQDTFVLVDDKAVYVYLDTDHNQSTYIAAVQFNTGLRAEILHYRYLLDWIQDPPVVRPYPKELTDETQILNHLSKKL